MPYLLLAFFFLCTSSLSAQRTVEGRVVDARTDEPLPYASVIASGTTVGTVTSPTGDFSLVLPPAVTASAQLEVSYVGYRKQTIAVDTLTELLVRLEPEVSPLDILPEVRARRSPIALNDQTPAASLRLPDIYALAPEGLLLTQAIDGLPGVQVQSAALNTNRLSIRGIGARTPFSTDQVRIYWNDIPLTNGVGESALDDLEPGVAGVLTVWRGPSPALTGSNLGGAIQLEQQPFQGAGLRLSAGDFGRRQVLARVGFSPTTNWQTDLMYARTHTDGYRANNRFDRESLTWTGAITDGGGGKTSYLAHYRGLKAQIPSSLSRTAYENDPRQAAAAWGAVRAGEDQDNLLLGLTHERPLGQVENRTSLFGGTRTNDEVRPFGVLVEDSRFGGLRTRFSRPAGPGEVELGGELFGERYEQDNFETLDDGSAGDPIGSHDEDRWYYFGYLGWRLQELERIQLEAALTVRQTGYDRLRDDGVEDRRTFAPVVLPRVALGYRFGSGVQLFGLLSRGISVPGADNVLFLPEVETGDLEPETGWNREVGLRGSNQLGKQLLTYELTVFHTSIRNALVSRQTEQQQPYLINGGRTRYQGAELFVDWLLLPGRTWLKLTSAYTYINASFVNFSTAAGDFTGNDLPGVPPHRLLAWLTLGRGGFTARLGVDAADKMPANDANSEFSGAYQVLHLRLSYNHYFRWLGHSWVLEGRAGAENLTDERYASMLQVNAAGFGAVPPRFFYPGLPRYGFLGLSLRVEW